MRVEPVQKGIVGLTTDGHINILSHQANYAIRGLFGISRV